MKLAASFPCHINQQRNDVGPDEYLPPPPEGGKFSAPGKLSRGRVRPSLSSPEAFRGSDNLAGGGWRYKGRGPFSGFSYFSKAGGGLCVKCPLTQAHIWTDICRSGGVLIFLDNGNLFSFLFWCFATSGPGGCTSVRYMYLKRTRTSMRGNPHSGGFRVAFFPASGVVDASSDFGKHFMAQAGVRTCGGRNPGQ